MPPFVTAHTFFASRDVPAKTATGEKQILESEKKIRENNKFFRGNSA